MRRALDAGAEFVASVNNDVALAPGWLEALLGDAARHPEAGLWNGLLLFAGDTSRVNSTGIVFDRWLRAFDRDFGRPLAEVSRPDGPIPAATGGALLLRAEALRRAGLFDPGFFAYYEDADLSLRAAEAGIGCRYVAAARAEHRYGATLGSAAPRRRFLLARNHLRFAAAHLPLGRALGVVPCAAAARAVFQAPLELFRGRPRLAWAHLAGAAAGLAWGTAALLRRGRGRLVRGAAPGGYTPSPR
jgi:GT2 family glycosyltransferase